MKTMTDVLDALADRFGRQCLFDPVTKKYVDDIAGDDLPARDRRLLKAAFESGAIKEYKSEGDYDLVFRKMREYTSWDESTLESVVKAFADSLSFEVKSKPVKKPKPAKPPKPASNPAPKPNPVPTPVRPSPPPAPKPSPRPVVNPGVVRPSHIVCKFVVGWGVTFLVTLMVARVPSYFLTTVNCVAFFLVYGFVFMDCFDFDSDALSMKRWKFSTAVQLLLFDLSLSTLINLLLVLGGIVWGWKLVDYLWVWPLNIAAYALMMSCFRKEDEDGWLG